MLLTQAGVGRLQVKCDGTRRRTGGEVKGKLSQNMMYPALLPLMRTPRLLVVD